MTEKKPDPLAAIAERVEKASCKHPHLAFTRNGFQLKCIDCAKRYIAAIDNNGMEFDIGDFSYIQPGIVDGSFRHSPDETQRTEKRPKIAEKSKKIR